MTHYLTKPKKQNEADAERAVPPKKFVTENAHPDHGVFPEPNL